MINYKGHPCLYKPITCQEGVCIGCEIYLNRLCPVCGAHMENWREVLGKHECIKEVKDELQ